MKRKFYTDISSLVQKYAIGGPLDRIIDNLHDVLAVSVGLPDSVNRNGEDILSRISSSNELSSLLPGEPVARCFGSVQQLQVAQTLRRIFGELVILRATGFAQEAE
jgi:hypothetical protein